MGDHAQFEVLMRSWMSEKNDERKAAEAQFEALVRTPPQAAPLMCTAMADGGYRRVEWKCDLLNAPSARAALR